MKTLLLSLLPKKLQRGVALNFEVFNIKPRLVLKGLKDFQRLIILATLTLTLLGYQPALNFPPIRQAKVSALTTETQIQEIQSDNMPEFALPHPGYVSTRFNAWHPGVDLATGLGMPIHPIADGVVEEVNFGVFGYGNHVILSHPKNFQSLYGHMGRVFVKKGQIVSKSDYLGTVGLTGFTSGPHTHLEVQKNGAYIDPLKILPPVQDYPSEEYLTPYKGNELGESKSLKPDFK